MIIDFLKKYFESNDINQCRIATKTGIARSKVNLTLNGKRKLAAEELLKIAIVFDIDLEEIKKEIKTAASNNDFKN